MAEIENGQVRASDRQTELLEELVAEVRGLKAILAIGFEELRRYQPILDAYLRPDASGPVAWAIRRQSRKAGQDERHNG